MTSLFENTPDPDEVSQYGTYHRPPPSQSHSPTSQAAAVAIEPSANTLRAAVLDAIRAAGPEGLTDEAGAALLGMSGNTYRPRRIECVESGWVRDSGRTRRTTSGRAAVVWISVRRD